MMPKGIFVLILTTVLPHVVHTILERVPSTKPEVDADTAHLLGAYHGSQWDDITVVDEKAYFAKDISKTWKEAGDYCRSFNMELATIETPQEWAALSEDLAKFKGGGVWTDARESRRPTMYTWNHTGDPVNPSVVKGWDDRYIHGKDYHFCSVFYSYPSAVYPTGMYPVPCKNNQKILCQRNLSKTGAPHTKYF